MARLSRSHRLAISRAVRSYHRTVRAIVTTNPGTSYRHAQRAYATIKTTRDLKPTAHYVRSHPVITRSAVRSIRPTAPPSRATRARVERADAIADIGPAPAFVESYQEAPYSPADEIEDLESLDELIDYFDGLDDFDDYDDVEVEANADYKED